MILSFFIMYKKKYILTLLCVQSTNNLFLVSAKFNIKLSSYLTIRPLPFQSQDTKILTS